MKRNMDLIREIMLRIEEHPEPWGWIKLNISPYSKGEIAYHVKLLKEAGLIEATSDELSLVQNVFEDGEPIKKEKKVVFRWVPHCLTWQGHEFLDAARDNTIWNKAKNQIMEKTGGLPFELLRQMLFEIARSYIFT